MELKRIADSRTPDAEKLIALHRETFPEYERFCDTPLMANMIDHERSMYFNAVYEKGELAGLFVYWDLGDSYTFILLPSTPKSATTRSASIFWTGFVSTCTGPYFWKPKSRMTRLRHAGFVSTSGTGFWNWPKTPEPSRITAVAGIPCGSWEPGPWKTSTTT